MRRSQIDRNEPLGAPLAGRHVAARREDAIYLAIEAHDAFAILAHLVDAVRCHRRRHRHRKAHRGLLKRRFMMSGGVRRGDADGGAERHGLGGPQMEVAPPHVPAGDGDGPAAADAAACLHKGALVVGRVAEIFEAVARARHVLLLEAHGVRLAVVPSADDVVANVVAAASGDAAVGVERELECTERMRAAVLVVVAVPTPKGVQI